MLQTRAGRDDFPLSSLTFPSILLSTLSGLMPSSVLVLFTPRFSLFEEPVKLRLVSACTKHFITRVNEIGFVQLLCF